jgi:hypothetical protein
MNDSIRVRPASGLPSEAALTARNAIYGGAPSDAEEEQDQEYEEPGDPVEFDIPMLGGDCRPVRAASHTKEGQFAKAFQRMLSGRHRQCRVKINKVGFSIPILDYAVSDNALCLILNDVGWDSDWPVSEDVSVTLPDGRTFKATYLGGFHSFREIGVQIVWFILLESSAVAAQSSIDALQATT